MPRDLAQWLDWQTRLHPRAMDLGLERVREVLGRLGLARPPFPVVTVAGTNGKGSTVAFMEAALVAAGHPVGAYTSPHLLRYNERVRIRGAAVDDPALCAAFERVEAARGGVPLTYFEFGTLAALVCFARAGVRLALLEVGLGGRLDAVNAVDPALALITPVDLDHQAWLGPDREAIGAEKAGILRPGVPLVLGDRQPPESILRRARELAVPLYRLGADFDLEAGDKGGVWHGPGAASLPLPAPGLPGAHQWDNAAAAVMALQLLRETFPVPPAALARGLAQVRLPGRQEALPGDPPWLLDVGHNPHAARALAARLADEARPTVAVVGMLADKDARGYLAPLLPHLHALCLAGLETVERGAAAAGLLRQCPPAACPVHPCPDVPAALEKGLAAVPPGGRLLVCGSFHTVAAALEWRGGRLAAAG